MNAPEALRSIRHDWLSYIQERVKVEFDNALQAPDHFTHKSAGRHVREILGRFGAGNGGLAGGFLVEADDGEVYYLYFQSLDADGGIRGGGWVLSFRVLSDEELMAFYRDDRKMLTNPTVKRVVDFHGHLCPELVIGMKACEYARELLFKDEEASGRISAVAENRTSALDALQVLLGVTLGNQCLKVFDFGKHNYSFRIHDKPGGFTLRLKVRQYGDENEYILLEERIIRNQATLDDVVKFQQILDARVSKLLSICPEELFEVDAAGREIPGVEAPTIYLPCSGCGQQVLKERAVEVEARFYCIPCFELLASPVTDRRLN